MRIILADHHPQALWALKTMLQVKPEIKLVGEATDANSLLAQTARYSPDLALIDWELPGKSIPDLIAELHAFKPKPIVVIMSSKSESGRMILRAGADAFASKTDQPDWLLDILSKFERECKKKTNM